MVAGELARGQPPQAVLTLIGVAIEDVPPRHRDAHPPAADELDEAHHRLPPAGFKYLVAEMLCWAAGGPQSYSGRAMDDSHRHLRITAGEWQAFLDDLQHKTTMGDIDKDIAVSAALAKSHREQAQKAAK